MDWMDIWNLGTLVANRAYQEERWPEFHKALSLSLYLCISLSLSIYIYI